MNRKNESFARMEKQFNWRELKGGDFGLDLYTSKIVYEEPSMGSKISCFKTQKIGLKTQTEIQLDEKIITSARGEQHT